MKLFLEKIVVYDLELNEIVVFDIHLEPSTAFSVKAFIERLGELEGSYIVLGVL